MADAFRDFKPENSGGGLFVKIDEDNPVKLRVLTVDPLINVDETYGATRFAFVVYNFTEGKAQILNKGWSIAGELQKIHLDEDFGADIQKVDVKITATGSGKETRYSVNPLPNAQKLTDEQLAEVIEIDLEKVIKNGTRMSEVNAGKKSYPKAKEVVIEDIPDEEVNLDEIPF